MSPSFLESAFEGSGLLAPLRHNWALAQLDDAPYILGGVAEFAAGNAGTEIELADSNAVILDLIGEVVTSFGHGSYKNGNALVGM